MVSLTRAAAVLAVFLLSTRAPSEDPVASGPLELDSARGVPGQIVEVPVRLTFDAPLLYSLIRFHYDIERLAFLGYDVKESAAEVVDPDQLSWYDFGDGRANFGILLSGVPSLGARVPPGERRLMGRLRFRVRADAPAGAAAVAPLAEFADTHLKSEIGLDREGGTTGYRFLQESLIAGSVLVEPPQGARPIGDLGCSQFLDEARLSFTLTEAYSGLEVRLDGELVSTLPGDATSFAQPIPGLGTLRFSVTALGPAGPSFPAECEIIATPPAAPSVRDLACGPEGLSWINPVVYDEVLVYRDGNLLSSLPGDATGFVDPEPPTSMALYSVSGILQGYRGPDANCLWNAIWIMEVGDVEAPLDADRITVPVFVTNSETVTMMDLCLRGDRSRFTVVPDLAGAVEGTVGSDPEFLVHGPGYHGPCDFRGALIYDLNFPRQPEKDLAPGLRQHVFNFILSPVGPMEAGETFTAELDAAASGLGTPTQDTVRPDVTIPGTIRFGSSNVPPVENLQSQAAGQGSGGGALAPEASDIRLSWENGGDYELLRIERNGEPIAEIAGEEAEYVDPAVPNGVFTYKVVAHHEGKTSFPRSTYLSTVTARGTFLRGDSTHDGAVDIADPIRTLTFLFAGGQPLPCEDGADANDDGKLEITDAILTLGYLFSGTAVLRAPGTRYPWYDPTQDELSCAG